MKCSKTRPVTMGATLVPRPRPQTPAGKSTGAGHGVLSGSKFSPRGARFRWSMRAGAALGICLPGIGTAFLGCTQQPLTVPVRSLENSGAVSFVCLNPPGMGEPGLALDTCTALEVADTTDFVDEAGVPH